MKNKLLFLALVITFISVLSGVSASDENNSEISATQNLEINSDYNQINQNPNNNEIKSDSYELKYEKNQYSSIKRLNNNNTKYNDENNDTNPTDNKTENTSTVPSTQETPIMPSPSEIKGSDYIAYKGIKNIYMVALSSNNIKLINKNIKFIINGETYYKTTNNNGEAQININLDKGTYKIEYYFEGDDSIGASHGFSTIYVNKGMPTHFERISFNSHPTNKRFYFKAKLLDKRGNPVPNVKVIFKIKNKKYTRTTNKNGMASISLKLKKGTYKINYSFKNTPTYKKSSSSCKIYISKYVKANKKYTNYVKPYKYLGKNNTGVWLKSDDMTGVNLNKLAKYGINHIFLNSKAVTKYGMAQVEKFINDAKMLGINTHIWMQVFYSNGKWKKPTNKIGQYNYALFNSKIKLAKKYASIKGIAGIHFDYLRFPGTAYKYRNAISSVNYFTSKCSIEIRNVNSNCIISAAVMAESMPSMKKSYGQNVRSLSKYLDVIIPMAYKGNYKSGRTWIKSITKNFRKNSKGANLWMGLQTYKSDKKLNKLSATSLFKDAKSATNGGATGIVFFRSGLIKYTDFSRLW